MSLSPLKGSSEGQTASLSFLGKSHAACVPGWTLIHKPPSDVVDYTDLSGHFGNNSTILLKYPPLPLQVSEICLQSRPGFGRSVYRSLGLLSFL